MEVRKASGNGKEEREGNEERIREDSNLKENKNYGDEIGKKNESDTRLAFMNVNSFPRNDKLKMELLKELVTMNSVDVYGMVELNVYWPKVHHRIEYMKQHFHGGNRDMLQWRIISRTVKSNTNLEDMR